MMGLPCPRLLLIGWFVVVTDLKWPVGRADQKWPEMVRATAEGEATGRSPKAALRCTAVFASTDNASSSL